MEKNNFWNEASKCGAVVGVVLALSSIVETLIPLSGKSGLYVLMAFEWIAVVALHYYLLHRFTRIRSRLYSEEEGFTFVQGYTYLLTISGFAGILVGLVQYIVVHVMIGYASYTERVVVALNDMISKSGGISPAMESIYAQMLNQIQNTPAPSVLSTVGGGIFSGLLFGAIFGLIIAGVLSRAPRPFDSEENQ